MSKQITVLAKQSLLDIAIQTRGTISAAFELALLNKVSVTDVIEVGTVLNYDVTTENTDILGYYTKKNIKPATALSAEDLLNEKQRGIGYMQIGKTFIVS